MYLYTYQHQSDSNSSETRGRMNKFAMIAADITEQITSGAYKPGDRLPTIPELCEKYRVSKITVKRAMDRLVMRGLVARRRGSGTFVRSASLSQDYTQPEASLINFKLHEFEVRHPTAVVAQFLRIDESEFVFYIHRTRIEDGTPYADEFIYLPIRLVPRMREDQARVDFMPYLEGECGLRRSSVNQYARAILPDVDTMRELDINPHAPLLEVEYTMFQDDGQPFLHALVRHTPDYELRNNYVL